MSWTDRNLAVQGYCMSAEESHALRWGLRSPTALCLGLVVTGLALQSAVLILGGILISVCGVLTVTNFCIPSAILGIWWRRRGAHPPATQPS